MEFYLVIVFLSSLVLTQSLLVALQRQNLWPLSLQSQTLVRFVVQESVYKYELNSVCPAAHLWLCSVYIKGCFVVVLSVKLDLQ